jgi:hypothetical protein
MDCQTAIDRLTREQAALRALGLKRLSLWKYKVRIFLTATNTKFGFN